MDTIKTLIKHILLFFSWLLLSPIYFVLSKKITKKSLWFRSFWTVLSPFTLVLVVIFYYPIKEVSQYTRHSSIHRITHADLPSKLIYSFDGFFNSSFRDHTTTCHAYFWRMPTEIEYAKLDSLCNVNSGYWSKRMNDGIDVYSYSRVWGNGIETPKGENENGDRTLAILIKRGSKKVVIEYGSW